MATTVAHRVAGPAIALEGALARLADEPDLALLDAGPGGPAVLAWGEPARALDDLADLPAIAGTAAFGDPGRGWPAGITGGAVCQFDYEFPVGPWALACGGDGPRGWWWPLRRFARWDADGACSLHAADDAALAAMGEALGGAAPSLPPIALREPPRPAWDRAGHVERVERIRAAIARGDCYQANLTVPWRGRIAPATGLDAALYLRLRAAAPGGHGALLRRAGRSVISHSPECFLHCDGRLARSLPIKGTRRRDPGREAEARRELLAAAKDQAELAMIVDLVRNDLARVARRGGVRVESPAQVVDLPYVHHLVARVAAELREGTGLAELLAATFPAGSITGAPKIAAMRLLRELEAAPRGPYCGAVGWIGAGARCAWSVAIRTMVLTGDELRLDAGGGIVADSDGDAEWDEALAKAGPMLAAVGGRP